MHFKLKREKFGKDQANIYKEGLDTLASPVPNPNQTSLLKYAELQVKQDYLFDNHRMAIMTHKLDDEDDIDFFDYIQL